MPGIVGLITKMPKGQAEAKLSQMIECLRHESSYVVSTFVDETLGVYVGCVLRKNSFAQGVPIHNEHGNVILAFSGEDYPEPEFIRHLKEQGHTFDIDGPSYLVHAYEEDPGFPANLNGRFHGLVIDRRQRRSRLFNDRYGLHRVYYHQASNAFYFAAEAKAILKVRPELRAVNPQSLGEFISCGCVLENRSLFKEIYVLPPASLWSFRDASLDERGKYFDPSDWESQTPLEPDTYYQIFKSAFTKALPRYFRGPGRVAVSLTGGLDTRMIMAWWKAPPGTLPCYSFGGMYRDCEDVLIARRVAAACGQAHEVIAVGSQFLASFPHYAERTVYLSDGCASVNRTADLYVNERAKTIAPNRITGNYGSEILRKLVAFKPCDPASGLFNRETLSLVHAAKKKYADLRRGHAVSFIAFRQVPWHHYGLLSLEETQLSTRSPYLDNGLVQAAFRAPDSAMVRSDLFTDNADCMRLIAEGDAGLKGIRTDRGLNGASAFSRALLEFTFKAEYACDYGMPQWLARIDHVLSPLQLERLFLGRHKFYHYRVWYRNALSNYVREMLLDSRALSRPYLERTGLEAIVRGHLKGDRNYTTEIHKLLTLELLHRVFIDSR